MENVFFKWSYFILVILWFFIRMSYGSKSIKIKSKIKKRVVLESFLVFLNYISMLILPIYIVFSNKLDFATIGLPSIVRYISLIIYGSNLGLFIWCHKSLGRNWSTILEIKEKHRFIQTGPYKKIRHPMYTHFWLLIISQGLILDNWIVLIYGIFSWGLLYFLRVRKEEEMMVEEFGDEYIEYIKTTGRLIPKI